MFDPSWKINKPRIEVEFNDVDGECFRLLLGAELLGYVKFYLKKKKWYWRDYVHGGCGLVPTRNDAWQTLNRSVAGQQCGRCLYYAGVSLLPCAVTPELKMGEFGYCNEFAPRRWLSAEAFTVIDVEMLDAAIGAQRRRKRRLNAVILMANIALIVAVTAVLAISVKNVALFAGHVLHGVD